MIFSVFIVFWALGSMANCIPIHKRMTREEFRATFQNGYDSAPDYEVVSVFHTLHEQGAEDNTEKTIRVDAFNREINLYLEPNDGVLAHSSTPVWTVSPDQENPENLNYTRILNPFPNIGRAYHDLSEGSAIVTYQGEDGEILILGNLNSELIIRPLPHRLHKMISRETRNENDSSPNTTGIDENFRQTRHHVVFKKNQPDVNSKIKIVQRDKIHDTLGHERSKRSIPDIIYPEILVIVDYSLYTVLDENLEETTRYIFALWNAVDLRYRLLAEPKIRLHIAEIIISLTVGGTAYLDDNRRGLTQVDADLAITAMSHYFYNESSRFTFSSYDMAIAMTHLDMCNIIYNDVCDTATLGYAYEMGACNRSHIDRNTEAVGIVEDNGGFKAIISAAHEVAHLMGVSHDGFEEATDCSGYDGFIMSSSLNPSENNFSWSNCSLQNLYQFFRTEQATCLFNKPQSDIPLLRILPGKLLTLDKQCERISGTRACCHNETVCTRLECYMPGKGGLCVAKTPAAEGSYCGDRRHCINGQCISETAAFVPYVPSTTMEPFQPADYSDGDDFFHRKRFDFTRYNEINYSNEIH